MFYRLALYFQDFLQQIGVWPFANVLRYQTFRLVMAIVTSFFLLMIFAPAVIRMLRRLKIGGAVDFDNALVNQMNSTKAGVPTMGGILIVPSIIVATLLWADVTNFHVILGIVTVAWLGALGAVDDYLKIVKKSRDGLRMWEKLLFQIGLAVLLAFFLDQVSGGIQLPEDGNGLALNLPFYKFPIHLTFWSFAIVAILVVAGTSNAVNLTDGMDGLAVGSMVPPTIVFLIISYIAGRSDYSSYLFLPFVPGAGELTIFCAAILGASLAFLWHNCSPAQVFMGDTGSLALGGAIGYVAIATAPPDRGRPVCHGSDERDDAGLVLQAHAEIYGAGPAHLPHDAAASPFSTGRMDRDADGRPFLAYRCHIRRNGTRHLEAEVTPREET